MKKLLVIVLAALLVPMVHAENLFPETLNFPTSWFQAKSVDKKPEKEKMNPKKETQEKTKTTPAAVVKKRKKNTDKFFNFSHSRTIQGKKITKVRTTTDPEGIRQLQDEAAEKAARKDDPMFKRVEVQNLPDGVEITYFLK